MGRNDIEAAGNVLSAKPFDDGVEMFGIVRVQVADAIEEAVVFCLLGDEGSGMAEGAYFDSPGIIGEAVQGGQFFDPEGDAA